MIVLAVTIIVCVTAVTIYGMKCSTDRVTKREQTMIGEITRHLMEKGGDTNVQ